MPLTEHEHRGPARGTLVLVCGILCAFGTAKLADGKDGVDAKPPVDWPHYFARVLQCQFPIPIDYEVLLRSLDDGAISFANRDLMIGGSIKLSKYVEDEGRLRSFSGQKSFEHPPIRIGPLSVQRHTLQLSPSLEQTDYVHITDTREEVVLIGQAASYWESMVAACIETLEN